MKVLLDHHIYQNNNSRSRFDFGSSSLLSTRYLHKP